MVVDPQGPRWTASGEERLSLETGPDTTAKPRSFYGAPLCANLEDLDAHVAFLGIPHDQGGSPSGQRLAPNSLRDTGSGVAGSATVYSCTNHNGEVTAPGYYDIDTDRQWLEGVTMADCGDVPIVSSDVERNFWRITRAVRKIVSRGSLLVAIGGDHSITPAVVRAFDSHQQLDIVHFDAHLDYADHAQGIRWSSGAPIRRVSEFPWVGNITQIGMRMTRSREPVDASRERGNQIITTDQFHAMGADAAIERVPESNAIYVTFDIDVMDPSVCPGTGTPEPGGLSYVEMRAALRALARRGRVVGMDVVEIGPRLDPIGLTSKTASRLIVDFLGELHAQGQFA